MADGEMPSPPPPCACPTSRPMARVVRRWGPLLLGGGAAAGLGYALSRRRAFPVQVDPTLPLPTLGLPSRQQQLERVTAGARLLAGVAVPLPPPTGT